MIGEGRKVYFSVILFHCQMPSNLKIICLTVIQMCLIINMIEK